MSESKELSEEEQRLAELMEACNAATLAGDVVRAEALAAEVMAAVMVHAKDEPSPWLAFVTQAAAHEDRHEWPEAEACYREALKIAAKDGPAMIYKAHSDLADFCSLMGREEEALAEARLAEQAACDAMQILHHRALQTLADFECRAGNWDRGRELIEELLGNEEIHEPSRKSTLAVLWIARALCRLEEGDVRLAQEDLDRAWPILEPLQAPSIMVGHHGTLSRWWVAQSRLLDLQSDPDAAVEAYARAVEHRRIMVKATQVKRSIRLSGLVRYLEKYAALLRKYGRTEKAQQVEAEYSDLRVMLFGFGGVPPAAC